MSQPQRLVLAYPGDLETRTGGYLYDRRLALELEARGWQVERLSLPASFPFPTGGDLATAADAFAALPAGTTLLVDGLALGAMPELAAGLAARHDLVALVHHPLCLETGLDDGAGSGAGASERAALACATGDDRHQRRARRHRWSSCSTCARRRSPWPCRGPTRRRWPVARAATCRMLCVGTITPRKGHLVLVEALAGHRRSRLGDRLLAGSLERDPATAAALRAAIAARALQERVRLIGELGPEALAALYQDADLCVSASFYEGYGMALAEALARGLPIVAAAGGAVADTVPGDGRAAGARPGMPQRCARRCGAS